MKRKACLVNFITVVVVVSAAMTGRVQPVSGQPAEAAAEQATAGNAERFFSSVSNQAGSYTERAAALRSLLGLHDPLAGQRIIREATTWLRDARVAESEVSLRLDACTERLILELLDRIETNKVPGVRLDDQIAVGFLRDIACYGSYPYASAHALWLLGHAPIPTATKVSAAVSIVLALPEARSCPHDLAAMLDSSSWPALRNIVRDFSLEQGRIHFGAATILAEQGDIAAVEVIENAMSRITFSNSAQRYVLSWRAETQTLIWKINVQQNTDSLLDAITAKPDPRFSSRHIWAISKAAERAIDRVRLQSAVREYANSLRAEARRDGTTTKWLLPAMNLVMIAEPLGLLTKSDLPEFKLPDPATTLDK